MSIFYVDYESAMDSILSQPVTPISQKVSLFESLGRILMEDIKTENDNPPANVSAMDGYAVKWEDITKIPVRLKLITEIPAGNLPKYKLKKEEAVKVFTGSLIPNGADVVVPFEYTIEENGLVTINKCFSKMSNIREKGEDLRKGETILKNGMKITPVEMGILASLNKIIVKVSVKPRIGIIVTGNEIVEPGDNLDNISQIRNSNAYTLFGLVKDAGVIPEYFGIVRDNPVLTRDIISKAIRSCDIVITSGGISMGDYDFIKDILPELGVETVFYKVKVKPGKPVLFGRKDDKYIFALPGFPVSTVVSFNLFVYPFIQKFLGAEKFCKPKFKGVLLKIFERKKAERTEFVRCRYRFNMDTGNYEILPFENQGSGVLSLMKGTNVGLMEIPPGIKLIEKGEIVDFIVIK